MARLVVILVTAFAMLLPLPARCALCSTGADMCSRCVAADTDKAASRSATRDCCQRPATPEERCVSDSATQTVQHSSTGCGCGASPDDRTFPTEQQLAPTQDQLAAIPTAATSFADNSAQIDAAAFTSAGLPPLIPHRILHCSWLI